jgi:transcriptional regulator with GAF, ATPase, and Fis domain
MLIRVARQISAYIERIWEYSRLVERKALQIQRPSARIDGAHHPVIVGESPAVLRLLDLVDQVADSEASVLILGETGVGKELLAQRIHERSQRASGPFVAVDLSAIPESLIESELFGHEKGAFTGADRQKPGRLELAHQGTLFIDEVGEIPAHLQTKLLRVFQEKTFVRIGASRPLSSDFRLVAATNRDLEVEVAEGRFRKDLYYRLNVVPLRVPPLRERGQDVILLAKHFISHYGRKHNRPDIHLTSGEKAELLAYHWPGNVRELQNIIERAVLLAEEDAMGLNLPNRTEPASNHPFTGTPTMEELQRRYIKFVLEKTAGRIGGPGGAAEILGMKRTTLYTRMKKLGIG